MGFRRQQYRQVQFNQSFGQGGIAEQRIFIPAPVGGVNFAATAYQLPAQYAEVNSCIVTENGLLFPPEGKVRANEYVSNGHWEALIPFVGSTSADSRLFGLSGTIIYNLTPHIDSTSASVSAGLSMSVSASAPATSYNNPETSYDWLEVNKTLIMVGGSAGTPSIRYTAALNKFEQWDATASGDAINNMWGINVFKSRIYCWKFDTPVFYYGDVEQLTGTLSPFDLSNIFDDGARRIVSFFGMTRDGGSGPDDFATFVADNGQVAVYQGSDPGNASDWSLVGVYQIGKPTGRKCYAQVGSEVYYMCQDDLYVLPRDLQGKRDVSAVVKNRTPADVGSDNRDLRAAYDVQRGWALWSDGTVLNVRYPGNPATIQRELHRNVMYNNRIFFSIELDPGGSSQTQLVEFMPVDRTGLRVINSGSQSRPNTSIKLAPIQTNARTNISMYRPIIKTSSGAAINFKTRVLYDYSASADWLTASASGDTSELWFPGFGTGRSPQIEIDIVTASAQTDIYFHGIEVTLSEQGGL